LRNRIIETEEETNLLEGEGCETIDENNKEEDPLKKLDYANQPSVCT